MKKTVLSLVSFCAVLSVSAQTQYTMVSAKKDKNSLVNVKAKPMASSTKAEGDILWSDNFTTTANWTTSNAGGSGTPPHTAGDWAIVNAVPASLVSQAPSYGFPTAMLSASGGNFAFINSDGPGAGQTQNAYITTTTGIDVATLLSNNGSAANAPLYVKFTEIYRNFYDRTYLEVSNDGGATWTSIEVNPESEVPVNTNSGNPEIEVVNITNVIGTGNWGSDVRIRFHYTGAYDWFWGVDDVQLVEAWANDAKLNNLFVATDITTTQGLDYFIVPTSQASFPGLTFGALVTNNGGVAQPTVGLNVTSGAYNQNSSTAAIPVGAMDTLAITVPMPLSSTVGDYTVDVTTTLGATDADVSNNEQTLSVRRDANRYGRDNGVITGGISQVSSQDAAELKIGNVMEIFDNMDVYSVEVRLLNQSTAVGQEINSEIFIFNSGTSAFEYLGETEFHTIATGDLNGFVRLQIPNGPLTLNAGDVILVMAHHFGGANEVGFGMAQPTFEGTVLGYTQGATDPFQLTTPNAIMIRLNDQNNLGVNENADFAMSVYPNPANDIATVSFDTNGEEAVVIVTDLAGKVVATMTAAGKAEINTSNFAAGAYTVSVKANNQVATSKLIVRK